MISRPAKVTASAFGATDCYSVHPKPVGSARAEGEAMKLLSGHVLAVVVLYVIVVLSLFYRSSGSCSTGSRG